MNYDLNSDNVEIIFSTSKEENKLFTRGYVLLVIFLTAIMFSMFTVQQIFAIVFFLSLPIMFFGHRKIIINNRKSTIRKFTSFIGYIITDITIPCSSVEEVLFSNFIDDRIMIYRIGIKTNSVLNDFHVIDYRNKDEAVAMHEKLKKYIGIRS